MENFETNQLVNRLAAKGIPVTAGFELLPECNFDCPFCYVHLSKQERMAKGELLTCQQWLEIAKQAKVAGTLFILLTGGEPLLYPAFKELYNELKKMGFYISLNTNASLLTEEWAEFFSKNPPYKINVTLYGASDETYQKVCKHPHGYTLAIQGVKRLLEKKLPVVIHGSFVHDNQEDIDAIYDFAHKNNIHIETTAYMFKPIEHKPNFARMNALETGRCLAHIRKNELTESQFENLKQHLQHISQLDDGDDTVSSKPTCLAGKGAYWVNWQGKMYACGMLPLWSQPLLEIGFSQSWENIKKEANKVETPLKCHNCHKRSVCNMCMASLYREKAPDFLCEMTDAFIDAILTKA